MGLEQMAVRADGGILLEIWVCCSIVILERSGCDSNVFGLISMKSNFIQWRNYYQHYRNEERVKKGEGTHQSNKGVGHCCPAKDVKRNQDVSCNIGRYIKSSKSQ